MNPMAIMAALDLMKSGKLDGLFGSIPGFDKLKSAIGDDEIKPVDTVTAAVSVLVQYAPVDPEKAQRYGAALANLINAAVELKAALED